MQLPSKKDVQDYRVAVLRHWAILSFFVFFTVFASIEQIATAIFGEFVMPSWAYYIIGLIALFIAQFLAWVDMKNERDNERKEKERIRKYDIAQQTLKEFAILRDKLISHQNKEVHSGTELGKWIAEFEEIRKEVNKILNEKVSVAEHRGYDHIGIFATYAVSKEQTNGLDQLELATFINWRSRVIRDHKWIEKFYQDYSRYRPRADLEAISGQDPTTETDGDVER